MSENGHRNVVEKGNNKKEPGTLENCFKINAQGTCVCVCFYMEFLERA